MADAFRGLTIRLGADARPLQSAISSITRSASAAQSQLNKMTKALRFDSTNAAALASRLDLAGDKATHMAREAVTIRTALNQAGKEAIQFSERSGLAGGKLKNVANNTREAYAATQKLRSEYNHVDTDLAHIYERLAKARQEQAKMSGEKLSFTEALRQVKQLAAGMESVAEKEKALRALTFMKSGFQNTDNAMFGFSGNAMSQANQAWNALKGLRKEQKALQSDLENMNKVEGFRAMRNELILAKSNLREAAAEATKFKAELYAMSPKGLGEAVSYSKRLQSVVEATTADLKVMDAAYSALPKNVEAARNKIVATRNAQQALKEQVVAIRAAMDKIRGSDAFDEMAASASNVHLVFERASHDASELAAELRVAEERANKFNAELNEAKNARFIGPTRSVDAIENDLAQANAELDEMRQKALAADEALEKAAVNRHFAQLNSELSQANTQLAEMKARSSVLNVFSRAGNSFREFGFGLYASLTPVITMAGRYAIQAAEDIDSAYRDMRKTVNGTEEDFEGLKQSALEFSQTHVTTADTILEIEAMGGQLGLAVDDLEAFATTISNLDIATNIDADTASEQLGKMASVLGITSDEYDNFGDALVRIGNNMPVMESDIMTLMTRFMGMGKVVGMSADEMLGWSAAASATGQKSEAAGSSMQRFISKVETAVTQGGDALDTFAGIAGMSATEFANKFRTDASGALREFVAGLGDMQKRGESVNQALAELGINNVRDKQLLEGLAVQMANAGDGASVLDQALRMASDAYNGMATVMADGSVEEAGDAAREAAKKSEGFSGELQMMKNNAMLLANELAAGATPILKTLSGMFTTLTNVVKNMSPSAKTATVALLGIAAAAGPVMVATGTILTSITKVVTAFRNVGKALTFATLSNAIKSASIQTGALGTAARGLMSAMGGIPLAAWAAGFVAVGAAIATVVGYCSEVAAHQEALKRATDSVTAAASNAKSVQQVLGAEFSSTGVAAAQAAANYGKYREATDKLTEKGGELAESWLEQERSADGAAGLIQYYSDKVMELAGNCEGNAQKINTLKAALSQYNQLTGSTFSIVDEYTGAIDGQTGAIERNTEAAKLNAYAKAYSSMLEESIKREAELTAEYESQTQALSDVRARIMELSGDQSNYAEVVGDNGYVTKVATGELAELLRTQGELENSLPELTSQIQSQSDATETWEEKLAGVNEAAASAKEGADMLRYGVADYTTALDEAGRSTNEFGDIARTMGQDNLSTFASSLSAAGISASEFAAIGMASFLSLAEAANNDFARISTAIDLINASGLDPLTIEVNDEGLVTVEGQIVDVDNMMVGEREYRVTSSGLEEVKADIESLDGTEMSGDVTITDNAGDVQGNVDALSADVEGIPDGEVEVEDGDVTEADDNVNTLSSDIESIPNKDVYVNLYGNASGGLQDIIDKLVWIGNNSTREVTITETTVKNASGGYFPGTSIRRNAMGGIFAAMNRHATGSINGIVTRPTLTNVGLTGEAGAEAILHMRHAGGAIIPLSNRRYVRPFAQAVAAEMPQGNQGPTTIINIGDVSYSENSREGQAVLELTRVLGMEV